MSEYQYVGFRAVDRPLSDSQMEYMSTQSTRAEITRTSFDNEYHFGDFRGNAAKMLQNGFDVHLHFANYGIRTVMFRLPQGLPISKSKLVRFVDRECVTWQPDAKGRAGIFAIRVGAEPGYLEELWNVKEYLERIVEVRELLIQGDLRPLYLAWLCGKKNDYGDDSPTMEPPVPAGLSELADSLEALLEFFDVDPFLVDAAAEASDPLPVGRSTLETVADWVDGLPVNSLRKWMMRLFQEDPKAVKSACIQAHRKANPLPLWPVSAGLRTYEALVTRAEQQAELAKKKSEEKKARERQKYLRQVASEPSRYFADAVACVTSAKHDAYSRAAQILSDIRDALGGAKGEETARQFAAKLKAQFPTRRTLISELRKLGLLSSKSGRAK